MDELVQVYIVTEEFIISSGRITSRYIYVLAGYMSLSNMLIEPGVLTPKQTPQPLG